MMFSSRPDKVSAFAAACLVVFLVGRDCRKNGPNAKSFPSAKSRVGFNRFQTTLESIFLNDSTDQRKPLERFIGHKSVCCAGIAINDRRIRALIDSREFFGSLGGAKWEWGESAREHRTLGPALTRPGHGQSQFLRWRGKAGWFNQLSRPSKMGHIGPMGEEREAPARGRKPLWPPAEC